MRRPSARGSTAKARSSTASSAPGGSTTTKPQPEPAAGLPDGPDGRFHQHSRIVYSIVGAYLFLTLLMVVFVTPRTTGAYVWAPYVLVAVTLFFLVRYLSTTYSIDDTHLRARRLFGGRTIRLEEIRRIEFGSLRDLVPVTQGVGLGSWGWHGRMYSPTIGEFDTVYTDAARGLLVTAGAYPLYISPRDPVGFARELSRRVRSYTGPLPKDVGDPRQTGAAQ